MERVHIVSVVEKTSKNNKVFYNIQLGDGRKGSSFNKDFFNHINEDINITVVKNGEYLNFDLPKEGTKPEPSGVSDDVLKMQIFSTVIHHRSASDMSTVIAECELVYTWLKS